MSESNAREDSSTNNKHNSIIAWGITAIFCIALVSFLFWQPQMARSMAAYSTAANTTPLATEEGMAGAEVLPDFEPTTSGSLLSRAPVIHTQVDTNLRETAVEYTVQSGDSVWGIADQYKISQESILYANFKVLQDNADNLQPGQVLTIPPTSGIWHKWKSSDTIEKVASKYNANPKDILLFIGNNIDLSNPKIEAGTYVMVPGGSKELIEWGIPAFTIDSTGRITNGFSGPGACSIAGGGLGGNGWFIWPAAVHTLSGNNFGPGHRGIDIAAGMGATIFAADSGVVVYAGWLDGGYGNFVVIDHLNGFITLYEHLDQISVSCGQNVSQGQQIGRSGTTGNSTGPHLHFEIRYGGAAVSPWDYLS